jgi:hypothetical protein
LDTTRIKERVVWDYYYIEIVKCYLCLALNHQIEDLIVTMLETWKLWGACDVYECKRRINAFVVQTIGHYFCACSYSLCKVQRLISENGDLSTYKEEIRCWEKGARHSFSNFKRKLYEPKQKYVKVARRYCSYSIGKPIRKLIFYIKKNHWILEHRPTCTLRRKKQIFLSNSYHRKNKKWDFKFICWFKYRQLCRWLQLCSTYQREKV